MKSRQLLVAIAIVSSLGCGGSGNPKTYPVSGKITLDSKPLDGAVITLVPKNVKGQAASGVSDSQGGFVVTTFQKNDGAMPGEYLLRIVKLKSADTGAIVDQNDPNYNPEKSKVSTQPVRMIPQKYENETTSGFSHSVPTSSSKLDVALKSKG